MNIFSSILLFVTIDELYLLCGLFEIKSVL